jgi:hypothetical protein
VKEEPVLCDENTYPDKDVTDTILGEAGVLWASFFDFIHSDHPDFQEEWNFYRDGGRWLLKIVRKKRTICWVSVLKGAFRVTFYFSDKALEAISGSGIPLELKEQFRDGRRYGKIRALTILMEDEAHIQYAEELIRIKMKI